MSTRIRAPRLLTIPEFRKEHPDVTENQLRWAIRHRVYNGLAAHTYRTPIKGRKLLLDEGRYLAHLQRPVPA